MFAPLVLLGRAVRVAQVAPVRAGPHVQRLEGDHQPLETERQDLREQGLQRLLKNPVRSSPVLRAPDRLDRLLVIMANVACGYF